MILIGVILILVGLFVAGWSILLWIGIGVVVVGLILNLGYLGPGPAEGQRRRWRYY